MAAGLNQGDFIPLPLVYMSGNGIPKWNQQIYFCHAQPCGNAIAEAENGRREEQGA